MIKRFGLFIDPNIHLVADNATMDYRGLEKAKRIYDQLSTLAIMKTLYTCPGDLKDVQSLSLIDSRHALIERMAEATRAQASLIFVSPDKIRLTLILIKKGEKDYFYYASFLIAPNGNLIKFEEDSSIN